MGVQEAMDRMNVIELGLLKYKKCLSILLTAKLEELYGGPKEWPKNISPTDEENEETLRDVWNEAIKRAIDIVSEGELDANNE